MYKYEHTTAQYASNFKGLCYFDTWRLSLTEKPTYVKHTWLF